MNTYSRASLLFCLVVGFKPLSFPALGSEQMSPAQQELKPQLILELARAASTVTNVLCGRQKALPTAWRKNAQAQQWLQ